MAVDVERVREILASEPDLPPLSAAQAGLIASLMRPGAAQAATG